MGAAPTQIAGEYEVPDDGLPELATTASTERIGTTWPASSMTKDLHGVGGDGGAQRHAITATTRMMTSVIPTTSVIDTVDTADITKRRPGHPPLLSPPHGVDAGHLPFDF